MVLQTRRAGFSRPMMLGLEKKSGRASRVHSRLWPRSSFFLCSACTRFATLSPCSAARIFFRFSLRHARLLSSSQTRNAWSVFSRSPSLVSLAQPFAIRWCLFSGLARFNSTRSAHFERIPAGASLRPTTASRGRGGGSSLASDLSRTGQKKHKARFIFMSFFASAERSRPWLVTQAHSLQAPAQDVENINLYQLWHVPRCAHQLL